MHWALPLAVRVTTIEAAISLGSGLLFSKGFVNFDEFNLANFNWFLRRIDTLYVNKLVYVLLMIQTSSMITALEREVLRHYDFGDQAGYEDPLL